jgi:DNA-binding protein HU-beta
MINKQELVDVVTDQTRLPRRDVEVVIDAFLELVISKLSVNEQINLSGFGKFEVRERKGRRGVNPRNPTQEIQVPSVRVAKFRPGKTLKEAVK